MIKRLLPHLIPVFLLFLVVSLYSLIPEPLEAVRLRFFDLFQQMQPRLYEPAPVKIIDVDEESLARHGQWPWPRSLIAQLVLRLKEEGAAVIGFDVLFPEPDRTSPRNIVPLWPDTPETSRLKTEIANLPDHDEIFAKAIGEAKVVSSFSLHREANKSEPVRKAGFSFAGDMPGQFLSDFPGAVTSLPGIEKAAAGNAIVNYFPEYDGIIRRVPLLFQLRGNLYPQLALEATRLFLGAPGYIVKSSGGSGEASFGKKTGIVAIKVGKHVIPTDAKGRIWLYDTGSIPERYVPAWRVLDKDMGDQSVKDSIVFIGTSAIGLKDLRSTPLAPSAAGVELHAQIAEQILQDRYLYRPDWAIGAEVSFIVALGLVLVLVMPHLGAAVSAVLCAFCFAGIYYGSWIAYSQHQWLVDPLIPSVACLVIYLSSSLIHFLQTDSEKRHIRGAFSRYLAPAIVAELANNPDRLRLGGEMKEMSLLFADIRGFTTLSERFEPEELTHFMNRFLTPMTEIILQHKGTIDKYMGDCIMAFWNAPLDDPEHRAHACRAALEMQAHLVKWNAELEKETAAGAKNFGAVKLGIGLNTGRCCVGNMGSDQRFDYSAMGDAVNLASRLESLSRNYGVEILAGENTRDNLPGFCFLEVDTVRVKGKTKPARLFALLGDASLENAPGFTSLKSKHAQMLAAYRSQSWKEALALARELKDMKIPGLELEMLYALYAQRIEQYAAVSPGQDWDGVTIAMSK